MLIKSSTSLALAAAAGLFFASSAEANPRFTIENTTDQKVRVHVYNGGDVECTSKAKGKTVGPEKTKTFGCTGNGKGKCKLKIYVGPAPICDGQENTCGKTAIKVDGGASVKISRNGYNYRCDVN